MKKTLVIMISGLLSTASIQGAIAVNEAFGKQAPLGAIQYNLVEGLPDIYLDPFSEKIGCTWKNGRVYDKPLIRRFYSLLAEQNEPFVVMDIGAQTGCFSLLAKFLPNSRWYSFEPLKEAADTLEANLLLNNIQNVSVYHKAASNAPGWATLQLPDISEWGLATLGGNPQRFTSAEERRVECIDLDSFVASNHIQKVHFMKLDTEGWELYVLQGAKKLIERDRPILLMEFNTTNMSQCGVQYKSILEFLQETGYEIEYVDGSEDILCTPIPKAVQPSSDEEEVKIMLEWRGSGAGLFSNEMCVVEWIYCVKQNPSFGMFINMNKSYGFDGNLFPVLFQPFEDFKIFTTKPIYNSIYPFDHFPKFFSDAYPNFSSDLKVYPTDGMKNYEECKYVYSDPGLFSDPDFTLFRERLHPIILKYVQPLPELQKRIDLVAQKMNHPNIDSEQKEKDSPNLKIGIHVRCIAHYPENNASPEQFLDDLERDIDEIMKSKDPKTTQIFLATLLEPLIQRISAKYNVIVCDIPRIPNVTSDWGFLNTTSNVGAARDVIVDTWCLAQCDEFWGAASNITVFVACLNPKLKIYMLPSLKSYISA